MKKICNLCGNSDWGDMGSRTGVRCRVCNSLERTRVIKLFMDKLWQHTSESKVLHFAPEQGLYRYISELKLMQYRAVDFLPENFKIGNVEKFNLCSDGPRLPSDEYDLILHSHVMEHIPCNVTAVLAHIHRALKPGGIHLLCVPFMHGMSEEDLSPLAAEEATRRFGQRDHVRKFGKSDVDRNLGMVFRIPNPYSLNDYFSSETLDLNNIPERERSGYSGTSVFPLFKSDYLLK